jgi:hypothetical protein
VKLSHITDILKDISILTSHGLLAYLSYQLDRNFMFYCWATAFVFGLITFALDIWMVIKA